MEASSSSARSSPARKPVHTAAIRTSTDGMLIALLIVLLIVLLIALPSSSD
jgi:hypothetical protein